MATPDPSPALAALDDLAARRPEVVALARVASVAAIVEPPLLRRLRTGVPGLAPGDRPLAAGAEADLWFSRLAHVATATQLTLHPAVTEALRGQLAAPEHHRAAEAAHQIVARAHAGHPDMVRLEERIIWSAVRGDAGDIGQALNRALAAIQLGPDRAAGVVRWFMQARRRLPRAALTHPAGRKLLAAVALHTDRIVPAELLTADRFPDAVGEVAPAGLPTTEVGVELAGGGLRFTRPDEPTAAQLSLPDTRPLVVEARWGADRSKVVVAQPGTAVTLDGAGDEVVLRTLAGHRARLGAIPDRQVTVAFFGIERPGFIPGSSALASAVAAGHIDGVTIQTVSDPADLYGSKPEVLVLGGYQPADLPALTELTAMFARAARRADPVKLPAAVVRTFPGEFSDDPSRDVLDPGQFPTFVESGPDQALEGVFAAVRYVAEQPSRMYQLDIASALEMLQALALGFHVRAFYSDEVDGGPGEQRLFDLPDRGYRDSAPPLPVDELAAETAETAERPPFDPFDESPWDNAAPESQVFRHVHALCEGLFTGPVRDYLDGGDDPAQDEPELDRDPVTSVGWSPPGQHWSSLADYLAWFVDQFRRYALMMRDRLGPRVLPPGFAVSAEALEVARLALGPAGLPLGRDDTSVAAFGSDEPAVLLAVERAELPSLITGLAAPVLAAVTQEAADRRNTSPSKSVLEGHAGAVTALAFSPDGRFLVSGGADNTARVWDLALRRQVAALRRPDGPVVSLAWAPDGTWLATGSRDGHLRIWDPQRWSLETELSVSSSRTDGLPLAVAPNGNWLAASDGGSLVQLWLASTWEELDRFEAGSSVRALAAESDAQLLVVRGTGDLVTMTIKGDVEPLASGSDPGPLVSLARSLSGVIAMGSQSGEIEVAGVPSTVRRPQEALGQTGPVNPVAVSEYRRGALLAHAESDHSVRLRDPVTMAPIGSSLTGHTATVNALAFSPGGVILASASDDGTIRLWPTDLGQIRSGFQSSI